MVLLGMEIQMKERFLRVLEGKGHSSLPFVWLCFIIFPSPRPALQSSARCCFISINMAIGISEIYLVFLLCTPHVQKRNTCFWREEKNKIKSKTIPQKKNSTINLNIVNTLEIKAYPSSRGSCTGWWLRWTESQRIQENVLLPHHISDLFRACSWSAGFWVCSHSASQSHLETTLHLLSLWGRKDFPVPVHRVLNWVAHWNLQISPVPLIILLVAFMKQALP